MEVGRPVPWPPTARSDLRAPRIFGRVRMEGARPLASFFQKTSAYGCSSMVGGRTLNAAEDIRFAEERRLLAVGVSRIAGVDEVGRGPLAGPVVAAAVILPTAWIREGLPPGLRGLNDSKQLSASRREAFFEALTRTPEVAGVVVAVEVEEIDRLNILRGTHAAMVRALAGLPEPPDHVLVDGLRVAAIAGPQTALVKGDARSYSIAAASVLAKVTRDRLMVDYDRRWPEYGFAVHKGYPTPAHLRALARHGPCPLHRRSFAPVREAQLALFPR